MLNQTRIDKHKADIEKRITELETKLREPNKGSQSLTLEISDKADSQYRRNFVQRQQYVEPQQVTALRQRQLNLRKSQRADQFHHSNNNEINYRKRASSNSSWIQDEKKRKGSPQDYGGRFNNVEEINENKKKSETKELYELMTQILNNQKNLERQLGLLRLEWNKEQTIKNSKGSSRLKEISHFQHNQETKSQVISFQDQQISGQPRIYEIVNRKEIVENENEVRQNNQKLINRFVRSTKKRNEDKSRNQQIQTFGIYANENESNQSMQQRRREKQKTNSPKKSKIQRKQVLVHEKLFNLVKNQRTRGERFQVKQQHKNEIWKKVQNRIKVSETEYQQSIHRNNRYEHEHLVNTNQLQKKLRQEIIVKIHNQSNNCLYK